MLSHFSPRRMLLATVLGLAGIVCSGTTFASAALAPKQAALYLNFDTCSAQQDISGAWLQGSYASVEAALAAIADGSAMDSVIQSAGADMNVHCRPCPPGHPSICIPVVHASIPPGGDSAVVEENGVIKVLLLLPQNSKVWVCCEPHCN